MLIDWSETVTFNPNFGSNVTGNPPPGGIRIPSYGEFGGPTNYGGPDTVPADSLDALFKIHDETLIQVSTDGNGLLPAELISAHATLIEDIAELDAAGGLSTAEASLYAGLATLALTAEINGLGGLESLAGELAPEFNLPGVLSEGVENMEEGLAQVHGHSRCLNGALHLFEQGFADLLAISPQSADFWV